MPPASGKGFSDFIGVVKYYYNMWAGQLHNLDPLTNLLFSKVKFKWTDVKQ